MTSDEPQNEAPLPPRSPFDRGKSHMSYYVESCPRNGGEKPMNVVVLKPADRHVRGKSKGVSETGITGPASI